MGNTTSCSKCIVFEVRGTNTYIGTSDNSIRTLIHVQRPSYAKANSETWICPQDTNYKDAYYRMFQKELPTQSSPKGGDLACVRVLLNDDDYYFDYKDSRIEFSVTNNQISQFVLSKSDSQTEPSFKLENIHVSMSDQNGIEVFKSDGKSANKFVNVTEIVDQQAGALIHKLCQKYTAM
jgi:hypothetical protein